MTTAPDDEVADLQHAISELRRLLDEALAGRDQAEAQKAAMAEILEIINASPGDLAPVFEAMLDRALRLCGAAFDILRRWSCRSSTPPPATSSRIRGDGRFAAPGLHASRSEVG
jgi:hypothetical protein